VGAIEIPVLVGALKCVGDYQCVAVGYSVLQGVTVCCSGFQDVAVRVHVYVCKYNGQKWTEQG